MMEADDLILDPETQRWRHPTLAELANDVRLSLPPVIELATDIRGRQFFRRVAHARPARQIAEPEPDDSSTLLSARDDFRIDPTSSIRKIWRAFT